MTKHQPIASMRFQAPGDSRLAVEVMSIDSLKKRAPAEHFEQLQRADFYRLYGVHSGRTRPMVDFCDYLVQARGWVLVRPGQVMRYDFTQPWSGWLLVFRPDDLFAGALGNIAAAPDLLRHVDDLPCLSPLDARQHHWMCYNLRQLQRDSALTAEPVLRNELLRLQLAGILLRLSMWHVVADAAHPAGNRALMHFKRFRHKLEADFARHHQVQHYANLMGMSDKHLSRVCLAATGLSAKATIAGRLVLEAKRLLAHTQMTGQTIGLDLGFEEPGHFVKFFRRRVGVTPSVFRLAQGNSTPPF